VTDGRSGSEIVLYQTEDGQSRILVRLEGDTPLLASVEDPEASDG
jgi:hypothetical protein